MTLPMILKQLRTELQLQQKELAELLSVNAITVNRWETGKTHPTKAMGVLLLRVAKEKGASEVCLASLYDVLNPTREIVEKTNDLRYAEIDSINQLVNEAPNGVIVIGYESCKILYMNNKMVEMTGVSMEEASTMKCYQLLPQKNTGCDGCRQYESDYGAFPEKISPSVEYHAFHGKYYIIHTKLITWKGQTALIKYFTDITELHELQQQVQQQQNALNCAAQLAGMQVIQYNIQENTAFLMTDTSDAQGLPEKVEHFDAAAIHAGIIFPEHEQTYQQMLQDIKDGNAQSEAEIQVRNQDGTSKWLHYQINRTALDEDGMPLTAIISARIINQEKSIRERIRFEHENVIHDQGNLVAYEVSNLTKNKVIEYHVLEATLSIPDAVYDRYDSGLAWGSKWIIGKKNQKKHTDMHRRDFLIECFSNGICSFSNDYRMKRMDGFETWIRNTLHLHQDIITGDIDLYEYYQVIDERKFFENLLQELQQHSYCSFAVLYLESGQLNKYTFLETEKRSKAVIANYATEIGEWCKRYVLPEDRNRFMECMRLQNLSEKLNEKSIYHFSYQFISDKGDVCKKLVRVIWLDYQNKICMISSMTAEDGGIK